MKVSMLDLKRQYNSIKSEIDDAVSGVIKNQDFILGKDVTALEEETAKYCGTKYGVGVASGTDALTLSLMALGVKAGDEVITSPFTFFATAESVSIVGAKPVFVDIDPVTYNIDPSLIEKKITKATKAIIPVHLYGQCADMDPIIDIAKKHGLKIIEDAAQAIGATYKGRKAGSMGDTGALSFFPTKNLGGFGDGGMVVTNNKDLADKIRMLRVHGSSVRYIHSAIGMNSRLDNIQAAVLRVKLKHLDQWLEKRREYARYYDAGLKGSPVMPLGTLKNNVHTYHLYAVRLKAGLEKFMKFLIENGIETRTYYPIPLHLQDCYKTLGYKKGDLRQSEAASLETCVFPLYPEITKEEMGHVLNTAKSFFK